MVEPEQLGFLPLAEGRPLALSQKFFSWVHAVPDQLLVGLFLEGGAHLGQSWDRIGLCHVSVPNASSAFLLPDEEEILTPAFCDAIRLTAELTARSTSDWIEDPVAVSSCISTSAALCTAFLAALF